MFNRYIIVEDDFADVILDTNPAGSVIMHVTVKDKSKWSLSKLREWKKGYPEFLDLLGKKGIKEYYSVIPKDAGKLVHKWQKLWGLYPIMDIGEYIIYRKEL